MVAACGGDGFLWHRKVDSITVSPADPCIPAGSSRRFTAAALYNDRKTADVSNTCEWSSSAPEIASIDAAGLATGLCAGTAIITATFDCVSGNTSVTVTAK